MVIIWRARRDHHLFQCTVEQVGEECFELRLRRGAELLTTEEFEEPAGLLERAEQLRREIRRDE